MKADTRSIWIIAAAALLAGCGGGAEEAEPLAGEAQRQAQQIENTARALTSEAENATSAIEQALENESAIMFENRNQLLNATGNEAAADDAEANQSR